ncbi:MAG: methylated-DNA--[protein]-cysteine S-methyltransferase [Candidatus Scalindua rubra]|nr:methylated-DNA--[protein]-cysteine S-methyltransferase [Candidatus Scalindua rubra]
MVIKADDRHNPFGIGNITAVRAVGNAVGKNPVSPIIPCHRVIRTDGKSGGLSSGIPLKKWF